MVNEYNFKNDDEHNDKYKSKAVKWIENVEIRKLWAAAFIMDRLQRERQHLHFQTYKELSKAYDICRNIPRQLMCKHR